MKVDSELGVALAAAVPFTVNGQEIQLAPLTLNDWAALDRAALQSYKDELIDTYVRNAEKLPANIREAEISKAYQRASEMTAADLPKQAIQTYFRNDDGTIVKGDNGKPQEVTVKVEYVRWWLTTHEGRRQSVWCSAKHAKPDITLSDIDKAFSGAGKTMMQTAANRVAELSEPQLKN